MSYTIYFGNCLSHCNGFYGHKWVAEELTDIANRDEYCREDVEKMCCIMSESHGFHGYNVWFEEE